jgi:hypothetical protein
VNGQGSIPGRDKWLFSFSLSRLVLRPTQPLNQWLLWPLYLEIKWPEHKADHSHAYSTKVKNGGTLPSPSHCDFMAAWTLCN